MEKAPGEARSEDIFAAVAWAAAEAAPAWAAMVPAIRSVRIELEALVAELEKQYLERYRRERQGLWLI